MCWCAIWYLIVFEMPNCLVHEMKSPINILLQTGGLTSPRCISQWGIFANTELLQSPVENHPLLPGIQIPSKQCITNLEANHAKNIFLDVLPKYCKNSAHSVALHWTRPTERGERSNLVEVQLLIAVINPQLVTWPASCCTPAQAAVMCPNYDLQQV